MSPTAQHFAGVLSALGVLVGGAVGCTNARDVDRPASLWHPEPWVTGCIADPTCDVPLVIAHRGMGADEPENTIAGIRSLATRGADMIEVDPRQTADGVFILMHDSTLSRTTDQPLLFPGRDQVTDLTWAEVQQLTISDPFDRCTAANADDNPERCRVPSLTQALDAARGEALVMLDFKSGDPAAIGSQLASEDATDFAVLFDADLATLAAARAQAPNLITVPRATDAASARDLLASDHPVILHADTGYLAEIQADALAGKAKLLVNIFIEVDFWLVFWREDGLDTSLAEGRDNLFEILDNGGRIVQTNLSSEVLDLVAEWRRQRGE